MSNVGKETHAKDGIDEHDEEKQHADVEECREGDDDGEEQFPDAFRCFDETQNATNAENADNAQQGRSDEYILQKILEDNT